MRKLIYSVFVLLTIATEFSLAQSRDPIPLPIETPPQHQKREVTQENPKQEKAEAPLAPIIQIGVDGRQGNNGGKDGTDKKSGNPQYTNLSWWLDSPQTVFSAAAFLATLVIAWVGLKQARIAQIAVEDARKGISLAGEGQVGTERAYLLMKIPKVAVSPPGEIPRFLLVQPLVTNAGKTPAYDINYVCGFRRYVPTKMPAPPAYDKLTQYKPDLPLSANKTLRLADVGKDPTRTGDDQDAELFFYGYLTYTDIFECERRVGFCWIIDTHNALAIRAGGKAYNYQD